MSAPPFSSLSLPTPLQAGVEHLGYREMTPVQAVALPEVLKGRDLIVQAEPGTGKTVTFGLGILAALRPEAVVQALVIAPTRELADQISEALRRLASRTPNVRVLTLCGGVRYAGQRKSLTAGAHIVVGTPGRLDEHLRKESLQLTDLRVLVLDEADRMLEMGFEPQLARVVERAPTERQTLLLSATFPESIERMSRAYQRDAQRLTVPAADSSGGEASRSERAPHQAFRVAEKEQLPALRAWLNVERPSTTLVFCRTRAECDTVARKLSQAGWVAASLHSDIPQARRQHIMELFGNGSCSVLAATDVAARGWDLPELSAIVNFGLANEPTVHFHRVGRVGRAGRSGIAVSFVSEEDRQRLLAIEQFEGLVVPFAELPAKEEGQSAAAPQPPRATLLLAAGKDKKLRPGDVLGALTAPGGVAGADVGKIRVLDSQTYVAVSRSVAQQAVEQLESKKLKGRRVRARIVEPNDKAASPGAASGSGSGSGSGQ